MKIALNTKFSMSNFVYYHVLLNAQIEKAFLNKNIL